MTVDQAWGELNECTRRRLGREELAAEDVKAALYLSHALWDLGVEHIACPPEWLLDHAGVLMLSNPAILLHNRPELERFSPQLRMFMLIRSRLDEF
jgi:hypothetical protein